MLMIQVPSSSMPTLYLGPKLCALHDHIFTGYLFLCLIDAHRKTPLLGFHQVPLDPGQTELLQNFYEDDSYDNPLTPDPSNQDQHGPNIDECGLDVMTSTMLQVSCNPPSFILFTTSKSWLPQTQHSLLQDLFAAYTEFPTVNPT